MSETTIPSLKALFRFPFQGPEWRNRLLIGAALTFAGSVIPIVPTLFVGGYLLRVMRRAIRDDELSLPAWEDWGGLAMDGLRLTLVCLVFFLPGLAVIIAGCALHLAGTLALPLYVETTAQTGEGAMQVAMLTVAVIAIPFLSTSLGLPLLLLGVIPLPMAVARFVDQDRVGAAFRVREWWPLLTRDKLGYLIAWVVMAGLGTVLYSGLLIGYYSVVLCCVVPILQAPAVFYLGSLWAALFGRAYRGSQAQQPAGTPSEPA